MMILARRAGLMETIMDKQEYKAYYAKELKLLTCPRPHINEVYPKALDNCDDLLAICHIEILTRYRLNQIFQTDTISDLHKQLATDMLKLKPYSRLLLLYRNSQPGVKQRMYKDIIKGHFKAEKTWLGLDILENRWITRHNLTNADLRLFYQLAGGIKLT